MATLTSNMVQVGVSMVLQDQFSSQAGQVTDSFRRMYNDIRTAAQATRDAHDIPIQAIKGLVSTSVDAYKAYAQVGKDVFLTASMSGKSTEDLETRLSYQKELMDNAKNLNLQVPLTTADISSAQKFMAMAGMSRDMIMATSKPVSQLASIFSMDAGGKGGVADIMTNIMATFQMAADQAQGLGDDILIATTRSNMNLRDLGDAIKYSGAEMMTAGISFREGAAAIGLLGDMGIQGSSAGTAIANTLRYLRLSISGQKTKGHDALTALGLGREDFLDAQGNLKSLHHMYTTVAKALVQKGLTNDEIGTAFYNIFGVRGSRNMLPVVQQLASGTDKMSQVLNEMQTQHGILNETVDRYMQSDQGQIDLLKSTVDSLKMTAGESLGKAMLPILQAVNTFMGFLNSIADTPFGGLFIRGGFILTLMMGLQVIKSMGTTFTAIHAGLRSSSSTINTAANNFTYNMKLSLALMEQMALLSQTMAVNSRMMIGNVNGAPAYLGKNKSGTLYASYVNAAGKRTRTSGVQNVHSFLMGQGMRQTATSSAAKAGASFGAKFGVNKLLGMGGKLAARAAGLAIPGLNLVMTGWMLWDVGKMIYGAITDNTKAQKAREAQEQAKAEREAKEQARKEAIRAMSWEDYIKATNQGMLAFFSAMKGQDGKPIGSVNIIVNGQNIGKMISDQTLDATEYLFNAYNGGLQNNLIDQGF